MFAEVIDLEELALYNLEDEDGEFTDKKIRKARFRFLEFLGKKYNIVVYISKSSTRTDVFRKLTKKLILIDNRTK